MTTTSFRVRLAVALGLPLVACSSPPKPEPVTPPGGTTPVTAPVTATKTVPKSGVCEADQIHERVCGLVDASYEGGGGNAPAPYAHCTMNALPMTDVDTDHVRDGWKVSSHDEVLASFHFDAARTASYKYDGTYEPDAKRCCYARCNPIQALAKPRGAVPGGKHEYELCIPSPETTKYPAPGAKQCPVAVRDANWWPYGTPDAPDDAPFVRAIDEQCCYSVASAHRCPPNTFEGENGSCHEPSPGGRPLREAGEVVVAPTRAGDGWHAAIAIGGSWSAAQRAHAAGAWAREAAFEHASVAAFARLAIDLMVHGAPAELVDAAHVAARDEIRHAQQCYGIASAFGREVVGPGPLALGHATSAATLEDLAVECFRDGCVNETVAALQVAEAARRSAPALGATLAAIADDEARHAELSYRILAWAIREGGAPIRARIAAELATLHTGIAGDAHPDHDESIGILAPHTAADVRRKVIADVVIPCTTALLGPA